MKGTLHILDRTGDTQMEWDTEVKNGPLDQAHVDQEFKKLVKSGRMLVGTRPDGTNEQIKKFDPETYTKITAFPAFVGG